MKGFRGAALPPRTREVDFALHDQDGQLVRLSALRGRDVLLTFLYTHCRDVCPLTANSLSSVLRQLGPAGKDVRIIAVSVDPKGDTPASVGGFIKAHHLPAEFRYLTGSRDELERIWAQYNSSVIALGNDQFRHDAYITLIDKQGNQRAVYKPPASASAVLHDLQMLLPS
jgi:protein SCO1